MIARILIGIFFVSSILLPAKVLAESPNIDPFYDVCQSAGTESAACKDKQLSKTRNPLYGENGVITKIIKLLSMIVALAAVVSIMYAGIRMITSGDKTEEVNKAREYIIYSLIALALAASAYLLVQYVLYKL